MTRYFVAYKPADLVLAACRTLGKTCANIAGKVKKGRELIPLCFLVRDGTLIPDHIGIKNGKQSGMHLDLPAELADLLMSAEDEQGLLAEAERWERRMNREWTADEILRQEG